MINRCNIVIALSLFVLGTSSNAVAAPSIQDKTEVLIFTDEEKGPLGVWDYEVVGTEEAYRKGVLFVRMEDGAPIVEVHLANGVLNGHDVQVKGDTVKFTVNIEGTERVSVVLNVTADTILGEASSSQGSFTIKGKRKLPPQ